MKILLTGAGGQVGTDLLPLLLGRGDEVAAFDIAPRPAHCPDAVQWVQGDITQAPEVNDVVRAFQPDRIFHFAAILSAKGEQIPHRAWAVNMDGTRNVLEAARQFGVAQIFYTSTIAVFGDGLPDVVGDDVPLQPTTMYGLTKVAGELLGAWYQQTYGIDFRGVRFPGLINAGIPGGGTSDYALFMYVDGLRTGAYESFVEADSKIPFMYMPDALRAVLELSDAPRSALTRNIYNIAAISPTAEEIADAVRSRIPGVNLTFKSDPVRQAILDSWPEVLDDANARADWGWAHEFDLEKMSDDLLPKVKALIGSSEGGEPVPA
ncbi:MAG: NAD-dependent epimerase/dehydratase family protein [Planctomycetota bacterium]|nr:NAD-dependent epimerase/dehydratase family protein [Planctomycetota bacterium]